MASDQFTIRLEELKEVAGFWSNEGDALSLYFQPPVPSELKHREESILAKENIQQKLKTFQGTGPADREDIRRLLERTADMRQDAHRRTRIIFACGRKKFWREYNIPGDFGVQLDADCAFRLAPLLAQQQSRKRYCIATADRNRARVFLLEAREISELSQVIDEEKQKIRTTGTGANSNLERKREDKVKKHYAFIADHLLHFHQHGDFDALLIGCRDEMWPEIEQALHPELKRILTGRFLVDPGIATREEIAEKAQTLIDEKNRRDEETLAEKVVGAGSSDGLGAVGLEAVIRALEQGEVRTLLLASERARISQSRPIGSLQTAAANGLARSASLCPNCAHLENTPLNACTLCGAEMRRFGRAEEALMRHALGRNLEVRILDCARLRPPDQIAAWLRFNARRNTAQALAS